VGYAWAGFGAAFGPVVVLSLYDRRMTGAGALSGMAVGAATVLLWGHYQWLGLYEMVPGVLLAALTAWGVSRLQKPQAEAEALYVRSWQALKNC
jgi:sodium/proline symporter